MEIGYTGIMGIGRGNLFVSDFKGGYKLWHRIGLWVIGSLGYWVLMWSVGLNVNNVGILGVATNLNVEEIIDKVNEIRVENNIHKLKEDPLLMSAAEDKIDDMFTFGYWEHSSPSKRTVWKMILERGYNYHLAGENLAKNFDSVDELVEAWVDSESHHANIVNERFKDTGVAVGRGNLDGKEVVLIVQLFGEKQDVNTTKMNEDDERLTFGAAMVEINSNTKWEDVLLGTKSIAVQLLGLLVVLLGIDAYWGYRINKDHSKKDQRLSVKYWTH